MSKVRVSGFSISVDGYGAGEAQSLDNPLGKGGEGFHAWVVETRHFKSMYGQEGGSEGVDNDFTVRAMAELADADKDFRKEMAEKGIVIPAGRVSVETEGSMLSPR